MPHVYILGAKIPAGGAYMAYRVGCLLQRHFGYTPMDVQMTREPPPVHFAYDTLLPSVPVRKMESAIREEDILLANPSFSDFQFGRRLPGRKLMYAQGFNTFSALDTGFDAYIAVSATVQRFLQAMYGIEAKVIPAFADVSGIPAPRPWRARPEGSALVYIKQPDLAHHVVWRMLKDAVPEIAACRVIEGRTLPQGEFLRHIGEVRHFINLSLAEGFGLPALEAMALGTCVSGLDGMGGSEYMRDGENCLTVSLKALERLPEKVRAALSDTAQAERLAEAGRMTAMRYDYAAFEKAWLAALAAFVGRAAHAG